MKGKTMQKIIDSHTHIYPGTIAAKAVSNLSKFYNFTVHEDGTFLRLEQGQRECGVTGFLLLPVATSQYNVTQINDFNSVQMKKAQEDGFECAALGSMHRDFPDYSAELDRFPTLGLKGIKLHPDFTSENCDSDKMFSLYELLEKRGLVLYLHVGDDRPDRQYSSPERVANIAKTFPHLKICAAHLGGYRQWDSAEKVLIGKFENVWYDCSSALPYMSTEKAVYLIEKCGFDRVMYGSDYPVLPPAVALSDFMKLGLPEQARENILYNNIHRFVDFG